jgi:hypothetical protein
MGGMELREAVRDTPAYVQSLLKKSQHNQFMAQQFPIGIQDFVKI